MSITNEQQQAIDYYADLAENGTMRPSDRQNLRHVLTVIREQAKQLAEAWELGKDAGLNGGWDNPYEANQ